MRPSETTNIRAHAIPHRVGQGDRTRPSHVYLYALCSTYFLGLSGGAAAQSVHYMQRGALFPLNPPGALYVYYTNLLSNIRFIVQGAR